MPYEKTNYRRDENGVVRYSEDGKGRIATLQDRTAIGRHKDGSIYIRATDSEDLTKAKSIADAMGINYRQRRGGASHFGRTGSYEHIHFDTPADAVNVHAALAYHLEDEGEQADHEAHLSKLSGGLKHHIQGKDPRVDGCMVNTRHAHQLSLDAGKADTPDAHRSAAQLHRLSAEAHRAQASRPWTKGEGAHHAGLAILHDAIAKQHDQKAMAAHKRIQAELKRKAEMKARMEAMEEGRDTKKALVHAHTRVVNGKLVQVHEHEDSRQSHEDEEPHYAKFTGDPHAFSREDFVKLGRSDDEAYNNALAMAGYDTGPGSIHGKRMFAERASSKMAYRYGVPKATMKRALEASGKGIESDAGTATFVSARNGFKNDKIGLRGMAYAMEDIHGIAHDILTGKIGKDGKPIMKNLGTCGAGTDLSTLEGGGALRAENHDEDISDATPFQKGLDLDPLPEPTPGQVEAGNYPKHHVRVQGLEISIENPKGSIRRGTDKDGHEWESKMAADYGYFTGVGEAKDGDAPDVFVGPDLGNQFVHIVNQVDPKTGRYDEMKVMLGYPSREAAIKSYLANYEDGWKGLGDVKSMHIEDFKHWLKTGDLKHRLIYKAATTRLHTVARVQMQTLRVHPAARLSNTYLDTIHSARTAGLTDSEILRTVSNATGAFAPLVNHLKQNA